MFFIVLGAKTNILGQISFGAKALILGQISLGAKTIILRQIRFGTKTTILGQICFGAKKIILGQIRFCAKTIILGILGQIRFAGIKIRFCFNFCVNVPTKVRRPPSGSGDTGGPKNGNPTMTATTRGREFGRPSAIC